MFKVIEVDGFIRSHIDITGKPNKYGKPKMFKTRSDAALWIHNHSYIGMSFKYEIEEEERCQYTEENRKKIL